MERIKVVNNQPFSNPEIPYLRIKVVNKAILQELRPEKSEQVTISAMDKKLAF